MARSEEPGPFDRGTPDTAVGRLEAKMADDERWVPEEDRPAYRAAMRRTMAYQGAIFHDALADLGRGMLAVLEEFWDTLRHPRRLLEINWSVYVLSVLILVGATLEIEAIAAAVSGGGK